MSLVENRKAHFNYEILEKLEAGIVLSGAEVKSLRKSQASLDGAFISLKGTKPMLVGMHISPYQANNPSSNQEAVRERALLLKDAEITTLRERTKSSGISLIPLSIYLKGKHIKVGIALVRGKKKHDKRETLKKRDADRDIARAKNAHN